MAIDTPARIAVLGAGPVGLEAALYARYLGYDVVVYERGRVAEHLLRFGHVRLFTPWRMNVSPLGLAALAAQDTGWQPPDGDQLFTARELVEAYFIPLAQSDLICDSLRLGLEVLAIGRQGQLKGERLGVEERADTDFVLLLRDAVGNESLDTADAVIDATGTYGNHNWTGDGGLPAIGELAVADEIEYGLPDVLEGQRDRYAGRTTLVTGAGYSAATNVVALGKLAEQAPGTKVIWATRRRPADELAEQAPSAAEPIRRLTNDRLPERDRLARAANALSAGAQAAVEYRPSTIIASIVRRPSDQGFLVELAGERPGTIEVDQIIANVGFRPDNCLYSELQVHECYASGGPMKLAAALLGQASADCLDQTPAGPAALMNPEPDFYILGSKSYGRNSQFLLSVGLMQVRDLFAVIGDRESLDLYANAPS
jgi:hypothetical protein